MFHFKPGIKRKPKNLLMQLISFNWVLCCYQWTQILGIESLSTVLWWQSSLLWCHICINSILRLFWFLYEVLNVSGCFVIRTFTMLIYAYMDLTFSTSLIKKIYAHIKIVSGFPSNIYIYIYIYMFGSVWFLCLMAYQPSWVI